jgi:hypothetical protein
MKLLNTEYHENPFCGSPNFARGYTDRRTDRTKLIGAIMLRLVGNEPKMPDEDIPFVYENIFIRTIKENNRGNQRSQNSIRSAFTTFVLDKKKPPVFK